MSPLAFAEAVRPLLALARRLGAEDAFQEAAVEAWLRVTRGACAPTAEAVAREVKRRGWSRRIDLARAERGTYVHTDPATGTKKRRIRSHVSLDNTLNDETRTTFADARPDPAALDPSKAVRFPREAEALRAHADEARDLIRRDFAFESDG